MDSSSFNFGTHGNPGVDVNIPISSNTGQSVAHSIADALGNKLGISGSNPLTFSFSSGDNYVDFEAAADANKGLTVTVIFLVLLLNGILLLKMLSNDGMKCFTNTRKMLLMSLAFGDVVMAAYVQVVNAVVLFDNFADISCTTLLMGNNYVYFILPMVYSVGIIVLAVEMFFRKDETGEKSVVVPLLVSFIPWIIGCAIAGPLLYANVPEAGPCMLQFGFDRYRAILATCVISPACLAVVVSLVAGVKAKPAGSMATNWVAMEGHGKDYPVSVDQSSIRQVSTNLTHDKSGTVLVALIQAGCTLPYAVFLLAYDLNLYRIAMPLLPYTVISMMFQWLVPFRSAFTSGIWLGLEMIRR